MAACRIRTRIVSPMGLHARSAAGLAKIASRARGGIWVEKDGQRADARDIMDMLTLACGPGTDVFLVAEDPADNQVLKRLTAYIENGFGETSNG